MYEMLAMILYTISYIGACTVAGDTCHMSFQSVAYPGQGQLKCPPCAWASHQAPLPQDGGCRCRSWGLIPSQAEDSEFGPYLLNEVGFEDQLRDRPGFQYRDIYFFMFDIDIYIDIYIQTWISQGVPSGYLVRDIYINFTDVYTNLTNSIFKLKSCAVGFVWILGGSIIYINISQNLYLFFGNFVARKCDVWI